MRNLVVINGCPSTIVTSPHHHHFLPHNKPQLPFLSLHNFTFLSLSNPISLTPLSNHTQTKLELTCYAKTSSNLIEDGSFNGFGLVGKTVLIPNVDGPGLLGSGKGLSPLREGKVDDVVGVLGCLAQLNVGVLRLAMGLLKGVCFKVVNVGFYLPFVVTDFKFSIEDLMERSDLIKTSNDGHSPRLTVRKEVNNGSTRVGDRGSNGVEFFDRRRVLLSSVGSIAFCLLNTASFSAALAASSRSDYADMPALRGKDYGKTKMRYTDYTETETGLQFKDLRIGTGPTPKTGDTVVIDWDGYTIGYYGRIFEARNKTKGGSFEGDDKAYFKFKLGSQEVIPAFEEAIVGMSLGGVRRIIVPPELGYPGNDYNQKGPRPTTFSGQRALDFVLRNQGLIDKTLLFDIELLKIIPN